MSAGVAERRTWHRILRRLLRMEIAAGHTLTGIQILGAGFFAIGPLVGSIVVLVASSEPLLVGPWDWVLIAVAGVMLCFVSIFMGASVLGGMSARAAQQARATLDAEDAKTGGDWHAEVALRSYYQGQVRFGQTLFGWLTLVGCVVAPVAGFGLWMEAGDP